MAAGKKVGITHKEGAQGEKDSRFMKLIFRVPDFRPAHGGTGATNHSITAAVQISHAMRAVEHT
jgi:hypothetical protein